MIDIVIQYAQDAVAFRLKMRCPALVIFNVAVLRMGRSIDLDDEGRLATEKVYGERPNRVLANEFVILQAPAPQA